MSENLPVLWQAPPGPWICPGCRECMDSTQARPFWGLKGGAPEQMLCAKCHGEATAAREMKRLANRKQSQFRDVMARLQKRSEIPALSSIASEAMRQFGGVEGFVAVIYDRVQHAVSTNRDKTALDGMATLLKFMVAANEQASALPPVGEMSDQELIQLLAFAAQQCPQPELLAEPDEPAEPDGAESDAA